MKCNNNIPPVDFSGCKDTTYRTKIYVVQEGDKFKAYEPDGNKLGRFIGYGEWDKNGIFNVKQEIPKH